jgi:hypothetical protein
LAASATPAETASATITMIAFRKAMPEPLSRNRSRVSDVGALRPSPQALSREETPSAAGVA